MDVVGGDREDVLHFFIHITHQFIQGRVPCPWGMNPNFRKTTGCFSYARPLPAFLPY